MHIGSHVQNLRSKDSVGIIIGRPAVSYCWNVRWTQGKKRGTASIISETDLKLVKVQKG
jgi:hypothetical protein